MLYHEIGKRNTDTKIDNKSVFIMKQLNFIRLRKKVKETNVNKFLFITRTHNFRSGCHSKNDEKMESSRESYTQKFI